MAPIGGGKRKRGDRNFSGDGRDDGQRPSPHRPGNLPLGQQSQNSQGQYNQNSNYAQRGGPRRSSRGGRGGSGQQSPMDNPRPPPLSSRIVNVTATHPSPPISSSKTQESEISKSKLPNDSIHKPATKAHEEAVPFALTFFDHLTDERMQQWKDSGRDSVLDVTESDHGRSLLAEIFDEIIRSVTSTRVDPTEAGLLVKEIITQQNCKHGNQDNLSRPMIDLSSLFLDCLSVAFEAFNTTTHLLPMLLATSIPAEQLRLELDVQLLEKLGLIRSTFGRVGIRQTTNLLYRQSNYNLLREETEGYSKLVTELFTMSSSDAGSGENVQEAFERVKGMIGAFDLDVGRVLDVTLDVFAAVLVKQNRFFVKYLRASSWWPQEQPSWQSSASLGLSSLPQWALPAPDQPSPKDSDENQMHRTREERDRLFWHKAREIGMRAWFELGASRPTSDTSASERLENGDNATIDSVSEKKVVREDDPRTNRTKANDDWSRITGTIAPSGNDIAAQVLGFKLRFYSSSARDPQDTLPVNLIYLAALLIKIGFISLRDLYPHLWPQDDIMPEIRQQKAKEKTDREKLNRPGGGALNALAAAGALADDTLPPPPRHRDTDKARDSASRREGSSKPESQTEKNTDVTSSEDQAELPEPSDQKVQLLKSLLCIGAIPEALFVLGRYPWLPEAFPELIEYIHRILHYSLKELFERLSPSHSNLDALESEKVVDDQSVLGKGQLKLHDAPPRRTMRWAQLDKSDTGDGIDYKFYWDDWANNVPICRTVDDVFTLCSTLLNFSGVKIGQDAELLTKLARIGAHSLDTDTSDENRKRWIALSKRLLVPAISLTKNSPGAVSEVYELLRHFPIETRYSLYSEWFLGQVSRMPEIQAAFELAKAETKDVLKRISKTTIRPMARALAKIALSSPGIVFQVAINQIEAYNNLIETVVECARYFTYLGYDVLIWSIMNALQGRGRNRTKSAGMTVSAWLSAIALFSGKVFKRYSIMNVVPMLRYVIHQLRRHNSTDLVILEEITTSMAGITSDLNLNESQILAMAGGELLRAQTLLQLGDKRHETKITSRRLLRALVESGLVGPLVILVAQERQSCVYNVPEDNADTKLLGNVFDEVNRILAQLLDLLRSNLSTQVFDENVPSVDSLINEFGIDSSVAFWISRQSLSAAMQSKDIESLPKRLEGPKKEDSSQSRLGLIEAAQISKSPDVEMADPKPLTTDSGETAVSSITATSSTSPWHPTLQEVGDKIRSILPEDSWKLIGRSFFVTFWTLTLKDMNVPLASYEEEIKKQNSKIDAINSDRTDISISGAQKKEREKKVLTDLQDRLRMEQKEHITAHAQSRARLQKEKEHWFGTSSGEWNQQNALLIQCCFFPRMIMSPADSLYAFRIFKYLHSSGTKNFNTKNFLDQFFDKKLMGMIAGCTSKEAENLGRWLGEILRDLGRWHSDKVIFEKEAYGTKKDLPGFAKELESGTAASWYTYEDYRRSLYDWHMTLTAALRSCLNGGDYMRERNAMNILKSIGHSFPVVNWMGNALIGCVEKLTKLDKRPDTKTAAMFILGPLKRKEAKGWVLPQAFSVRDQNAASTNSTKSETPKPGTPLPEDKQMNLNPTAPDFLPSDRTSNTRDLNARKPSQSRPGVEDGEIEDEKRLDLVDTTMSAKAVGNRQVKSNAESATEDAGSDTHVSMSTEPTFGEREAGAAALRSRTPNTRPSTNDTKSSASPGPPRPQAPRTRSDTTVESRVPPDIPGRPETDASRSNDLRNPDNAFERRPREASNSIQPLDPAQEAIRERLSRNQTRQDEVSVRDKNTTSLRTNYPDGHDVRRPHTGVDARNAIHYSAPTAMQNNAPGLQRGRPSNHQQEFTRRSGESNISQPSMSMPPPQPYVAHNYDNQVSNGRGGLIARPQVQGQSEQRAVLGRPDHPPHYGRQSRESSPHRHDTRRPRPSDEYSSQEPQYSSNERHRSQMGRHNQQPFPQEHHAGPNGQIGQIDGSRDFRNGPLESEIRQHPRRPDIPQAYPDRQDPQYGRLNNSTDAPIGPRVTNLNQPPLRSTRSTNTTQPYGNGAPLASPHPMQPLTAPHTKQTPTGPSSVRPSTRSGGPPPRPEPIATQVPPSPDAPDTAGVHPDRLKAIQEISASPTGPSNQRQNDQMDTARGLVPPASVPTSGPPRGPSGQGQSPTGPNYGGRGLPNGPAFNANRSDKRFVGIQGVLQQSAGPPLQDKSSQGTSIRGRGARSRNAEPSPIDSGPPVPMSRPEVLPREDLLAGRNPAHDVPLGLEDDQKYDRGRRRADARDVFRGDHSRIDRQRSRSPIQDLPSRLPPYEGEHRPSRRDERRQEPPPPTPEHDLRRSMRGGDERRMPPDKRDVGGWNHSRGGGLQDRRDDRERRDGGGSTRKRFRPGDEGPPERAPNHGDKRPRRMQ